jgi:hypothetical protein
VRKIWIAGVPAAIAIAVWAYAGAGLIQSIAALAIVYGIGYVTGSLLVDPRHDRTRLSLAVVRLIAGCLLTSIAFLLSLELSLPWFAGPVVLWAIAVIRHRHTAFVPPAVTVAPSRDGVAAALVALVLLAPPVIAALRMAPGAFPPVYFNVDVPYFLEQVHSLHKADAFPPESLSVVDGRRPYHFGLHALAAVVARGSGVAPHHAVFMILVPLLAAGILAAAVGLARAISPAVPSVLALPLLLTPIPTLWYDFSRVLVQTAQHALAEQSFDPFQSLNRNWEIWAVSPNIQNLAAHFLLLAGLGAVANAPVIGWRLAAFLLGSAFVFKSPVGIALVAGFACAQTWRVVMSRSFRPLIPFAAVAAVFGMVYTAFWVLSPVRGELRAIVWPLFYVGYLDSHGGLRWFVYDVAWLLLPALIVQFARRKEDRDAHSLPLLAFAVAPFIVVNVLRLEDLRRGFGISSMNEDDWRQVIMPIPVLLHAFVLSVVGRRWVHLGMSFRSVVIVVIVAAVTPAVAAAARYANVLLEQPERGHEYADNRAIGAALAVIPVTGSILVTNDLRYPADGFSRENLQMQIPSLFGHQGFAVNSMYEAYPFSQERRELQQLLEADAWTPAIDQAARMYHWTHLLIRKDYQHPSPIPLDQIFDSPLYSVYRFKKS